MASSQGKQIIDGSSIIDMEVIDGDESDYETNLSGNMARDTDDDMYGRKRTKEAPTVMEDMQKKVTQNVASYVWQSGSQQAKTVISNYANVDLLRPYFNVEPHEVRQRLFYSLIPQKPGTQHQKVPRELYGPTMLVFTLIALLLFQMKTGGHTVQEGTLMGTAFGTCFGYWLGVSSFMWFISYVCNTHITMLQLLCLIGYALFGHCVVLGLTTIFHTAHDHMFFYLMWAVFGGLSTLKMVSVITSRTAGQTQRLVVCGFLAFLHLCFLIYLHFAYHQMVEELSDMIQHVGPPRPGLDLPHADHRLVERAAVLPPGKLALNEPPKIAGDPAHQASSKLTKQAPPTIKAINANQAVNQAPNQLLNQAPNQPPNQLPNQQPKAKDVAGQGDGKPPPGLAQKDDINKLSVQTGDVKKSNTKVTTKNIKSQGKILETMKKEMKM